MTFSYLQAGWWNNSLQSCPVHNSATFSSNRPKQWSPLHPNLCYTGVSRIWSAVVSSCWLRWSPSAQSAAPLRSSHLDFQDIRIICRFFKISGSTPPTSGALPPPSRESHPSVPSLFAPTARSPATPWISPHSTPPASSYPPRVRLVHGIQRLAIVCPQFDNVHASSPPPQYILMIIMSPSSQNAPFFSEKSSHVWMLMLLLLLFLVLPPKNPSNSLSVFSTYSCPRLPSECNLRACCFFMSKYRLIVL